MQVEKGQVFRFDNGAFLLAVENKELTDPDEKIRCAWSKTGLDGEHLHPVKKSELEARTEILDEFYDVPERGFFSEAEEKFKFRHEACGQLAVTNDDFINIGKKLTPELLKNIILNIVTGTIGCIAELLYLIYTLLDNANRFGKFNPTEWFGEVRKETTDRYDYKHTCGHEIDFLLPR